MAENRPRRATRGKKVRDTSFKYDTDTPITEKKSKKQIHKEKQKEMKANPEILFCDFGKSYGRFDVWELQLAQPKIFDVQFHTKKPQSWVEVLSKHLEDQHVKNCKWRYTTSSRK